MKATLQMPFVFDLLRAETLWQDRRLDSHQIRQGKSSVDKINSLHLKSRFNPTVNVFVSDKERIFIFKFENRVMSRGEASRISEISNRIFLIEAGNLFIEDIVLDMRDKIVCELEKMTAAGWEFSSNFIADIEGKMDFFVRKVVVNDSALQNQEVSREQDQIKGPVIGNASDLKWKWKSVMDFDRLEKYSDDEVFEDEVVFKLVKSSGKIN